MLGRLAGQGRHPDLATLAASAARRRGRTAGRDRRRNAASGPRPGARRLAGAATQLGQDVFRQGQGYRQRPPGRRACNLTELLRACLVALRVPEAHDADHSRPAPFWTMQDAIAHITTRLGTSPGQTALAAFLPEIATNAAEPALRCRAALAGTLIASLELTRTGTLTLEQTHAWTPIQVHQTRHPSHQAK